MPTVEVRVPASSANLGPGFDSLGLALGLYNTVEVTTLPLEWEGRPVGEVQMEISGEGADELPTDASNAVIRAMQAVYRDAGAVLPGLRVRMHNGIPPESGLGSSSAAYAAGVAAASVLHGGPLDRQAIFRLTAQLEGHPDNAAAAVLGGLTAASTGTCGLVARQLRVASDLQVVVALPAIHLSTKQQRAALPQQVSLAEAAAHIGRAVLVAEALAAADYDLLAGMMTDQLHEPYRRGFIPGFDAVCAAAKEAGAAAVALSGSGPSTIAFAPAGHEAIGEAMLQAFQQTGVGARVWTLPVDREGVLVRAH